MNNIYEGGTIHIKINEYLAMRRILIERGARHGDAISPKLFILEAGVEEKYDRKWKILKHPTFRGQHRAAAILNELKEASQAVGLEINL